MSDTQASSRDRAFEHWCTLKHLGWDDSDWSHAIGRPGDADLEGRIYLEVETPWVMARATLYDSGELRMAAVNLADNESHVARTHVVVSSEDVAAALDELERWVCEPALWGASRE
jgi:hypothetical protein